MLELLSQFGCENQSIFAKVFDDGDSGLVELNECLKPLFPHGATSTQDKNDCESRLDTNVRCNAHDLISCQAQELAASAHIDLNGDDVVVLDDSDTDDDKCDDLLVLLLRAC